MRVTTLIIGGTPIYTTGEVVSVRGGDGKWHEAQVLDLLDADGRKVAQMAPENIGAPVVVEIAAQGIQRDDVFGVFTLAEVRKVLPPSPGVRHEHH